MTVGSSVRSRYVQVNGLRLHVVEEGEGPLVVLLHGFPEFWGTFRPQIEALAGAGFRVLAPDLRGYGKSAKPRGVGAYRAELIAADIAELVAATGASRAFVVGHDWGGGIAWLLAMRSKRVEKLAILNAPHPLALLREFRHWRQLKMSWYMFFFQLPALPEIAFRSFNYAWLRKTLREEPLHRGAFSSAEIAEFVREIARPMALTSALNYYRALFRQNILRARKNLRRIEVPTLLIWGEQDRYLSRALTEGLENWVPKLQVVRVPQASHWVHRDAPDVVNEKLLSFFKEAS